MKGFQLLVLSILSGLLLGLSWYFNLSFVAFFAFIPLLLIEENLSQNKLQIKRIKLKLFFYSFVSFLIWNLIVTWWVVNASFGGALMAFFVNSLLMAFVFLIYHSIKNKLNTVWVFLPIYLAWEYIHTLWDISWTWLTLGNVFAYHTNWIQWYELTGVSGGSLWVLSVNVFCFQLLKNYKINSILSKQLLQFASLIIIPIILSYAILFIRVSNLNTTVAKEECVIVQPNLDPYNEKFYTEFNTQFLNMLSQVRGKINLNTKYLLLPETFMINDMDETHIESYEEIRWFKDSLLKYFPQLNIITGASTYKFYQSAIFNGMGQGDVLLTPLQMANFTAAIVNDGWYYTPHIVKFIDGKPNTDKRFKEKHVTKVDPKYFAVVKKGMRDVFIGGTARGLQSKEFTQIGKTGTAQVPGGRDNSIFVLAAPANKPKIVVVAVIEHAGFGATWAGPASTVIAEKYILGEVKRENLYKKMIGSSFMGEYKRMYINEQMKKGWYVKPKPDSLQLIKLKDSLKILNDKKLKDAEKRKKDSINKKSKT